MLDAALRPKVAPVFERMADGAARMGFTPNSLTGLGLLIGVGACVAVAFEQWWVGVGLWLLNRLVDGLDGPLARRTSPTELGGFFDIVADMAIYGGIIVAIGIALPDARVACLAVFLTYYLAGTTFLAFSSLATKLQVEGDERSLRFPAGIAEGTETIIATTVILAWSTQAVPLLWVWAALVAITVLQRIAAVARLLR